MSNSVGKSNDNKQISKESSCEKISLEEYNNQSSEYTKKKLEELNQQLKESKFNKTKFNRQDANHNSDVIHNTQKNNINVSDNIQNDLNVENYSENCSSSSDDDIDNVSNNDSVSVRRNDIKFKPIKANSNSKKRKVESNDNLVTSLLSKYENEHNQVLNLNTNYQKLQKDYNKLEKKNHFLTLDLSNQKVSNENLSSKLKDLITKYDSEIQYNNIKTKCYHKEIDTYINDIKSYKFKIIILRTMFIVSFLANIYCYILIKF